MQRPWLLSVGFLVTVLIAVTSAVSASPGGAFESDQPPVEQPERVVDQPTNGRTALEQLEPEQLRSIAAVNDLSVPELTELLESDPSVWLEPSGGLLHLEPTLPDVAGALALPTSGPFPPEQSFLLHSRPGATKVLFLDFDGATLGANVWTESYHADSVQPPFDLDGDPLTFGTQERYFVQDVWQRVAEDYAPFDIDVTTQDPGFDAIHRSGPTDQYYGAWSLVSTNPQAMSQICGACGGYANFGKFDRYVVDPYPYPNSYYQPSWVFVHAIGDDAKNTAEVASHEVGHNLALNHHGYSDDTGQNVEYYPGHGGWAPIMGGSYDAPLSQWAHGEYLWATLPDQDDTARIQATGLPLRADDHGDDVGSATALGVRGDAPLVGAGVISTRTDRDLFSFSQPQCVGPTTADVVGAYGSNLDIRVRFLDPAGAQLATADPPYAMADRTTAQGLSASVSATLAAGRYVVEVDGVGAGASPTTGYSDYGSLGAFRLTVSPCALPPPPRPPTPVTPPAGGVRLAETHSVFRLYAAYLLRQPDAPGFAYWQDEYLTCRQTLAGMSDFFAGSPEFVDRYGRLSDAEFVALVYLNVLGRAPDDAGFAYWTGRLSSGAMTRGQVMIGFSESTEYVFRTATVAPEPALCVPRSVSDSVYRLYRAYFLREPDTVGERYWTVRYSRCDATLPSISEYFASSPEFQSRYGSLPNRGFVELVYQHVLGRTGEEAGVAYWTQELDSGASSRGGVVIGFSESAEYVGRTGTRTATYPDC